MLCATGNRVEMTELDGVFTWRRHSDALWAIRGAIDRDTRGKKPLILWFYMFANKDTQMSDSMFVDMRGGEGGTLRCKSTHV